MVKKKVSGFPRGGVPTQTGPTSTPAPGPVQGPTRAGTDVSSFRQTGRSTQVFTPIGGRGGGSGSISATPSSGPTAAQLKKTADDQARRESDSRAAETKRRSDIQSRRISGQLTQGPVPLGVSEQTFRETGIQSLQGGQRGGRGAPEAGVLSIGLDESRISPSRAFAVIPEDTTTFEAVGLGAALGRVEQPARVFGGIQSEASQRETQRGITSTQLSIQEPTRSQASIFAQTERTVEDQLGRRPTGEIVSSRFREVGVGVGQLGVGLGEFAIDTTSRLGQQTFQEGVESQDFEFGGILGALRDQPTGTGTLLGKTLVIAPAVGAGGVSFFGTAAQIGLGAAALEAAASFSPFQIRALSFGALEGRAALQNLDFTVASFKRTVGDVTTRRIIGSGGAGGDVSIIASQRTTKIGGLDTGFGITDISAPFTSFRLGTGFSTGFRSVRTESLIGGRPGGTTRVSGIQETLRPGIEKGLVNIGDLTQRGSISQRGFAAEIFSRPRARVGVTQQRRAGFTLDAELFTRQPFGSGTAVGGVSRSLGSDLTLFGGGPARRIVRVGPERVSRIARVERFNVRGLELDIGAAAGRGTRGGISDPLGGSSVAKQISSSIQSTQQSLGLKSVKAPSVITRPTTRPTVINGLQPPTTSSINQLSTSRQLVSQISEPQVRPISDVGVITTIGVSARQGTKQRTAAAVRTRQDQFFSPLSAQDIAQSSRLDLRTKTIQEQVFETPGRSGPLGFGFEAAPFIPLAGGFFPLGAFPTLRPERRKTKGKKRKPGRIAPSLTGLTAFDLGGITGPLPTGTGPFGVTPGQIRFVPGL